MKDQINHMKEALVRTMVLMMIIDGKIDEEELQFIEHAFEQMTKKKIEREYIRKVISEITSNTNPDLLDYLKRIKPQMSEEESEFILRAAVTLAASDGRIEKEEYGLMLEISSVLEIDTNQVDQILKQLTKGSTNSE